MVEMRIYNLFPRLIGSIDRWYAHLESIQRMDFNWIYVNPVNYTGFSGSLYSIKDLYQLNPLFIFNRENELNAWDSLKAFIDKCHLFGIKFMIDLVINHFAIDSEVIINHPEWFKKKWVILHKTTQEVVKIFEGEEKPNDNVFPSNEFAIEKRIANPYAIDPADARNITIWGDLAEISFDSKEERPLIIQFWKEYIDFCIGLGIDGFRCDAAYKVPSYIWNALINPTKKEHKDIIFFAETLGCTIKECEDITTAGFDYICSSSKWWDFTSAWCVEQYNQFRKLAPSISFPESHDTPRLAYETNNRKDVQIFRYLFAAFFSAGVLMPIGYEYGFKKKLDVVQTTPDDWEQIYFDIRTDIKKVNAFKQKYPCLNEDGELQHYQHPNSGILLLRKSNLKETQHMFLIYNKDWHNNNHIYLEDIRSYLNLGTGIKRVYLEKTSEVMKEIKFEKDLLPNEYVFLFQEYSELEE